MLLKELLKSIRNELLRNGFGNKKWKQSFLAYGENVEIEYPCMIAGRDGISIGANTTILNGARIQNFSNKSLGKGTIEIGSGCYICYNFTALNIGKIVIGNHVLLASNVMITSENHGIDPESDIPYMDQPLINKNVYVGDGTWIGQNVCILPGVKIGKKCIVGAGSVVTKSIPDYSVAVGNPAKVIKKYNFEKHNWERVLLQD